MNDFIRDDEWQRQIRDRILAPQFYGKYATEGRYVFIDKGRCARLIQRRLSVDTVLAGKDGNAHCIEEKIVRWPGYKYEFFTLETHSCTRPGHESEGWMVYGKADYLLYCFVQENGDLDCHLIDFEQLKEWFWENHEDFKDFGPLNTLNATKGKLVPIKDVKKNIRTWQRFLPDPERH